MGTPELEKVLNGIHVHRDQMNPAGYRFTTCDDCPYKDPEHECFRLLMNDVVSFVEAQQSRVMTLEEVFERSKHMDEDAVWIEFEDEDGDMVVYPAILSNSKLIFEAEYSIVAALKWEKKYFPLGTYGKKWRCWTSMPTDKQREATPWVT